MSVRSEVDEIIYHLTENTINSQPGDDYNLFEADIVSLIKKAKSIFLSQPMLLELSPPLKVCGNILGQFKDLLRIFQVGGFPPKTKYLFLGDYVDRGNQSVEVICLLLSYKIKYPNNIFLLRGHHECARSNMQHGFYGECKRRYKHANIWMRFVDCFNCLPVAASIEKKIFCCHGGLSPELTSLDQIRMIPRPIDVPERGLLCDLLYADPSEDLEGWHENPHGVSYTFGKDVVEEFLQKFDFDLVVRSHQVVEFGYEFVGKRQLVTVFTVPNFFESGNIGAMLNVNTNLCCSFNIINPRKRFNRTNFPPFNGGGDGNKFGPTVS